MPDRESARLSAEAVDAGETLGQQAHEQRGREADDVEVVALDPLDEAAPTALDRVAAGAALPLAVAEVVREVARVERAER